VTARNVSAVRFRRLTREAEMLAPFSFPESPAVQVSVEVVFNGLYVDEITGRTRGLMTFDDGSQAPCTLAERVRAAEAAMPGQAWEAIVALGGIGDFYVGHVAVAHPADTRALSMAA
jgi:hypothetical protein